MTRAARRARKSASGLSYQPKRDYCGCCGRDIGPESGNISDPWCRDCRNHVGKSGPQWDRIYIAITGEECPFQVKEEQ